jgi:hypothetical protein
VTECTVTEGATSCYQCGTDDPVNDKLGWLDLHHAPGTGWYRRFCGSICINAWSTKALDRITNAMLGPRSDIEANTALLAAAPDLLAACEAASGWLFAAQMSGALNRANGHDQLRARLHAAIAKATTGDIR